MVLPIVKLDVINEMEVEGVTAQFCLTISPIALFQQIAGCQSLLGESFKTSCIILSVNWH